MLQTGDLGDRGWTSVREDLLFVNTLDLSNRATLKLPPGWEILPPDPRGLFEPAWRRWHAAWEQKHGDGEPFEYGPARKGRDSIAPAKPRSPEGIEALVGRVPASGFPGDDPSFGPATRLLQRVAASVKRPSLTIEFRLTRGKTVRGARLDVLEGMSEPFWMATIPSDPPQCQTLGEVTELLGANGKGWALDPASVDVRCKSPKVPADAIKALVRDFLVETLAGGGAATKKKATAKKTASAKKATAKKAVSAKKAPAKRRSGA